MTGLPEIHGNDRGFLMRNGCKPELCGCRESVLRYHEVGGGLAAADFPSHLMRFTVSRNSLHGMLRWIHRA